MREGILSRKSVSVRKNPVFLRIRKLLLYKSVRLTCFVVYVFPALVVKDKVVPTLTVVPTAILQVCLVIPLHSLTKGMTSSAKYTASHIIRIDQWNLVVKFPQDCA
jgi:hypothetical protein